MSQEAVPPAERVERFINHHALFDIGPALLAKWTRRPEADQYSAAELADYLNVRGVIYLLGKYRIETDYTAEEIVAALHGNEDRSDVVELLQDTAVDPWLLYDEFVTTEEMQAYLEKYRFEYNPIRDYDVVEGPTETGARFPASEYEAELSLRAGAWRAREVGNQTLEGLEEAGVIDDTNVSIDVDYTFNCRKCGADFQPRTYISHGACPACDD